MPCLGSARINQSFQLMSNGLIRSAGSPTQCLDAANSNRLLLWTCDASNGNQLWKVDAGRLMNVPPSGAARCVRNVVDGMQATMATCTTGADQQWVSEDFALNVRADSVGRLRTPGTNVCLETIAPQGTEMLSIRGFTCAASGRAAQRFVRLNNGQYRTTGNLDVCLDAYGTADGTNPRSRTCTQPADPVQRWAIDPAKRWLSNAGGSMCMEASGSGPLLALRPCAIDGAGNPSKPSQQWAFVPEAGL